MPREYRHISQYEKEIVELRSQGFTFKEIGERDMVSHSNSYTTFSQDITKSKKS